MVAGALPGDLSVMERMHAVNDNLMPDTPLLQQLYRLYTAERQLALDLSGLFHQSTSIPMRLELSDRRKETTRHLLRLERIIQMTTGNPASHVVAGMKTLRPSAIELGESGVTLEVELRALQEAMVGYEAAISIAARLGHASIADLLTESRSEKAETISALSSR